MNDPVSLLYLSIAENVCNFSQKFSVDKVSCVYFMCEIVSLDNILNRKQIGRF